MPRTVLAFADCRLDVAARSLAREGERVDLPPVVFDCIAYLATHRERAVGRDELVAAVWGKSEISDTMLGKAILAARRAVGDSADVQALIRTVPRYGYHWVGAVRIESADESEPVAGSKMRPEPARRRAWPAVVAAALLVAAAIAAVVLHRPNEKSATTDVADAPAGASAVLPLDVLAEPDDAWLRLGLMDLIANRLRNAGVPVMSSDSVVSLLRRNDADVARLRDVLRGAHPDIRLVEASIAKRSSDWTLHATFGDRTIDASGADPFAAARAGADRLLEALGKRPATTNGAENLTLDALLQRTEAARLADELDVARGLIDSAPESLKALPAVHLRRAQIELRAGRLDDARTRLEALVADVPAETDPALRARILANLCSAESQLGDADAAIRTCGDAIDLGGAHGAVEPAAIAYNNRAVTYSRRRDFAAAEADFARARVAFERLGDTLARVRLDGNEASMLMGRGRPAEALPILERAERSFAAFGMPNEALIAITNEVAANRLLLRASAALAASERGWVLLARVQDRTLKTYFRRERAEALAANGRLAEAHALLDGMIGELDPASDASVLAAVRASQAAIELDAGQPAIAAVLAREAAAALTAPDEDATRAEAIRNEVVALHRLGREAEATEALATLAGSPSTTPAARVYASLATADVAPSAEAATRSYEAALEAASPDLPYLVAAAAVAYGEALIARGELERAVIIAGRVSRYAETDYASALLEARLYRALGERAPWQAALAQARGLAGERRIPARVADFDAAASLDGAPPNPAGTGSEQ